MWFIGVEVEQETSAPPPKKNPGSAPVLHVYYELVCFGNVIRVMALCGSMLVKCAVCVAVHMIIRKLFEP